MIAEVILETEAINAWTDYHEFSIERVRAYAEKLQIAVSGSNVMSEAELQAAYIALMTQQSILRNESERKRLLGENVAVYQAVEREMRPVAAALLGKLQSKIGLTEFKETRNQMHEAIQRAEDRYREQAKFGIPEFGALATVKNVVKVSSDPVVDPRTQTRGELVIGNAVRRVQTANPHIPLPGADPQMEQALRYNIGELHNREVYAEEAKLAMMQDQLQKYIDEASRQGVKLRDLKDARALALDIHKQRMALYALNDYKGLNEHRADYDESLYPEYVHLALGERMRRIRVYFGEDEPQSNDRAYTPEEIMKYYQEIQRWVTILLKNDVKRNPMTSGEKNRLNMDVKRFHRYEAIEDRKITDEAMVSVYGDDILKDIHFLQTRTANGGNFLRYFMTNAPHPKGPREIPGTRNETTGDVRFYSALTPDPYNPENLLGVSYQQPEEMQRGGYGIPEQLRDTMQLIAKEFSKPGRDFRTGGNKELIDAEGNFMYNNFYYWVHTKLNEDINYNKDGEITPYNKIIIKLPLGQISMYELLLLIPEYLSERSFDIRMEGGDPNKIISQWGEKTEHAGLKWDYTDYIAAELEMRQMYHSARVKYITTQLSGDKKGFLDIMNSVHQFNHMARAGNLWWFLGLPSSVANGTLEMDQVFNDAAGARQGSIGKAMCEMLMAYYYLSDLSDFYEGKDFNNNMFYKVLEPVGAMMVQINMAEGALSNNNQAKRRYAHFIEKRIRATANAYLSGGVTSQQREKIEKMVQLQATQLRSLIDVNNPSPDIRISFTESTHLTEFLTYLENDVFAGQPGTMNAEAIEEAVRVSLLHNLRDEYFADLVNMEVAKISTAPDPKNPAKRKERTGTARRYITEGTERFGDVVIEGTKMQDLLMGFDPAQILAFRYRTGQVGTNGQTEDPLVTERRRLGRDLTADEARAALERFMAKGSRNFELFKKNEKMMLGFYKHMMLLPRKELNHFRDADENEATRDLMANALQSHVQFNYKIDKEEAMSGWFLTRDLVYMWGIADMLDVEGIGFRFGCKGFKTGKWRARRGGKDGPGNEHTIGEIGAVSLPFLHALRVETRDRHQWLGHQSAWSIIQGGEGTYITPRALREFDPKNRYSIDLNAEEQYVANTLTSGADLVELLSQTEFEVHGIVEWDPFGNPIWHYDKAYKLFKQWRKACRYALEKNRIDYRETVYIDGKKTTLYEYFLGHNTRALNEVVTQEQKRTLETHYMKLADAVFMTIVGAEIAEHRRMFTNAAHMTQEDILGLQHWLIKVMAEGELEDQGHGHKHYHNTNYLVTRRLFKTALNAYGTGFGRMDATEMAQSFFGGLWWGLLAGIKSYLKTTSLKI